MRFEKPDYYAQAQVAGPGGRQDVEDCHSFCVPGDGVACAGCQWDAGEGWG